MPEKETIYTVQYYSPSSRLGINQETFAANESAVRFFVVLETNGFEARMSCNTSSEIRLTKGFHNYKFVVVKVTSAGPVCEWHKNKSKY